MKCSTDSVTCRCIDHMGKARLNLGHALDSDDSDSGSGALRFVQNAQSSKKAKPRKYLNDSSDSSLDL